MGDWVSPFSESEEEKKRGEQLRKDGAFDFWKNLSGAAGQLASTAGGPPMSVAPMQSNVTPQGEAPIGDVPLVPDGTESSQDHVDRSIAIDDWRKLTTPTYSGPVGTTEVMPGFENYLPAGGKEKWDEILKRGEELGSAIDAGAEAEAQKSTALADYVTREKARQDEVQAQVRARQLENQAEIAKQQKQIQDATERYSNDLADRGQYWKNPGNILSAIGAAFMVLASDDKAIGVKLIQQQMNADFNQRKALADMSLGEMRSNLAAYRQIAGDRDLGDRLAQADQNRIMAMEIDRIGQQFQGPIAKAKAAAIKQEFLRNYAVQMAQLHAAMIYNAPKPMPAPMAKAYKDMATANPNDMHPYANAKDWPGYTDPKKNSQAQGQPSGSAAAVASGKPGMGTRVDAAIKSVTGTSPVDEAVARVEARAPGARDLIKLYKNQLAEAAYIKMGANPSPYRFRQIVAEIQEQDEKDAAKLAEVASKAGDNQKGWGQFVADLRDFRQAAQSAGKDPDALLGEMRNLTPATWGNKYREMEAAIKSKPDNKHAAAELANLNAVNRVHQMLSSKVVEYYHKNFGGAMSDLEMAKGAGVISENSNFQKIWDFANDGAKNAGRSWSETLAHAGPRAGMILQINYGQKSPKANIPGTKPAEKSSDKK